jgi:hypothetical protein
MTGRVSRVCQEARDAGRPSVAGQPHLPCLGCDCACHHIPPPVRHIRNVYAEARSRVREQNARHIPTRQSATEED